MRWKNVVLLVAAILVINLPEAHTAIQDHRLSGSGQRVQATVLGTRTLGEDRFIAFRVPAGSPRAGDTSFSGSARVQPDTFEAARSSGRIGVEVLPGSTSVWRTDGEITSRSGLYLTLAADVVLVAFVVLYTRFRRALRPTLVLVAEQDLEPCPPGSVLDRIAGQRYVVCGEVGDTDEESVLLDLGDRRVRVILDGHGNPGGPGDPVRATGTMIA